MVFIRRGSLYMLAASLLRAGLRVVCMHRLLFEVDGLIQILAGGSGVM